MKDRKHKQALHKEQPSVQLLCSPFSVKMPLLQHPGWSLWLEASFVRQPKSLPLCLF